MRWMTVASITISASSSTAVVPRSRIEDKKAVPEMGAGREVTISLDGVRDKNVMQLKKLNVTLFPVRYNDKNYTDSLTSSDFTKLAYYSDICVGSIACRLEKKKGGAVRVFIMTLGVLASYRGLGIGTKLLNHVLDLCSKQNISEVYLHVQTDNDDAINFYKKFGFDITDTIQNYYTNITPPDCYEVLLSKNHISRFTSHFHCLKSNTVPHFLQYCYSYILNSEIEIN